MTERIIPVADLRYLHAVPHIPEQLTPATGLLSEFMGVPDTPENRKKFVATIPMGRFSTPEDIANACLYLGSDEAQFVTGVCIEVDGGRCV